MLIRIIMLAIISDQFLDYTRTKFVGFTLEGDRTTLAGLPQPIHEGVRILSKGHYLYDVHLKSTKTAGLG